jgi:SAM-dependent methyltransferase
VPPVRHADHPRIVHEPLVLPVPSRPAETPKPALVNALSTGFADYRYSANITENPAAYEVENEAFDSDGHVWAAMVRLAPWAGKVVVDLGCGTGFWLPRYASEAAAVIGIEPHPTLRRASAHRVDGLSNVEVAAGSAEHTGLPDRSADVVHARFVYFFGPGREEGLAEVLRILRPGGALVVVDNDYRWGEFAQLLRAGLVARGIVDPDAVDRFWQQSGATVVDVRSSWRFSTPQQLADVLRIELPRDVADAWIVAHAGVTSISYGYRLWTVRKPAGFFTPSAVTGPVR